MSSSDKQDACGPLTVEQLLEAVTKLNSLGESELKDALTSKELNTLLRLNPYTVKEALNDFASDEDLIDASPLPLSPQQHLALILASVPLSSHKQAKLQENMSLQEKVEALYALVSAIFAVISDKREKGSLDDTTYDGS